MIWSVRENQSWTLIFGFALKIDQSITIVSALIHSLLSFVFLLLLGCFLEERQPHGNGETPSSSKTGTLQDRKQTLFTTTSMETYRTWCHWWSGSTVWLSGEAEQNIYNDLDQTFTRRTHESLVNSLKTLSLLLSNEKEHTLCHFMGTAQENQWSRVIILFFFASNLKNWNQWPQIKKGRLSF